MRIAFLRVLRNILREFELVILVGKEFQRRGPVNFRERKPYWVVLTEATYKFLLHNCRVLRTEKLNLKYALKQGRGGRVTVCVTNDKQKRVSVIQ